MASYNSTEDCEEVDETSDYEFFNDEHDAQTQAKIEAVHQSEILEDAAGQTGAADAQSVEAALHTGNNTIAIWLHQDRTQKGLERNGWIFKGKFYDWDNKENIYGSEYASCYKVYQMGNKIFGLHLQHSSRGGYSRNGESIYDVDTYHRYLVDAIDSKTFSKLLNNTEHEAREQKEHNIQQQNWWDEGTVVRCINNKVQNDAWKDSRSANMPMNWRVADNSLSSVRLIMDNINTRVPLLVNERPRKQHNNKTRWIWKTRTTPCTYYEVVASRYINQAGVYEQFTMKTILQKATRALQLPKLRAMCPQCNLVVL